MYLYGSSTSYNTCNPCHYFNSIGTSISRWCSDGCADNCMWDACPCVMLRYAYLTQTEEISLIAGQFIPFSGISLIGAGFRQGTDGSLEIEEPGVYRLDYRVNIPSNASVNTTFVARINGVDVAGTQQSILHLPGAPATSAIGHAIVEVAEPSTLTLVSTEALFLVPDMPGDTLATLTITPLSH